MVGNVRRRSPVGDVVGRRGAQRLSLFGEPFAGFGPVDHVAQVDGGAHPGRVLYPVARFGQDRLALQAEGRRILVKGRTSKEMVMVEDSPEKEVHREKLKTTVVALDLHGGEITDIAA